jgi:hypothetical protein
MERIQKKVDHAVRHAAKLSGQRYSGQLITGQTHQIEAPHIIPLDNPHELKDALTYYVDRNKSSTQADYDHAMGQVIHEAQHFGAAQRIGIAVVKNELAIYSSGIGPFKKHYYEARTIPHTDDLDALAVITAHPEHLSAGDLYDLNAAGLDVPTVARIAQEHNWPVPLSQRSDQQH